MSLKASRNKASRKQPRREEPGAEAVAWFDLMTTREGAPPLRFKGRELARLESGLPSGTASITLWKRKTQGYVAAVKTGAIVDSVSANTLEEVMEWLEGLGQRSGDKPSRTSLNAFLSVTPTQFAAFRALRILIGQALDNWDRLQEQGAP